MAEEDLIFGKNRHFFGGVEPSNMSKLKAIVEDGKIKIDAQLPADTIVNGYTLCTVAGAVIRRKSDDFPVDEFDGVEVANVVESGVYVDSTADPTATYFYAAFPYTTQGVYSINAANQCVANGPESMVVFSVASEPSKVIITAELPANAAGAVIRKSTSGYPVSETDGNEFMTITSSGTYTDTDVVGGTTYYYAAFTYTAGGVYSRDPADRASVTVVTYQYLFGYDLDTTDSDPATRVTYPSDVDNAGYTPAAMNFSTGVFNYGSWPSTPGEKFMPKPCMLKYDGTVSYYLNPNDYTIKENGTASDVANTSFGGNAMMEWPKIYTKRWEDENGVYHFRCCDIKLDDDYDCWCNYDMNSNEIDHFYTAIYFGSLISNIVRSISGQSNMYSQNGQWEIQYAKNNGTGWYTEVLADRLLINDLLVMMAKTTNCQLAYGYGATNRTTTIGQGTMNTKGLFWGSKDYTSGVKVFGMENLWGNYNRRIAGWVNYNGTQRIKITRGTHDGSTSTDYDVNGTGYLVLSNSTPSGTSGGYISKMKTTAYGRIPIEARGSGTTYEADGLYFSTDANIYYCIIGGYWENSTLAGPFCSHMSIKITENNAATGTALSCKPSAAT